MTSHSLPAARRTLSVVHLITGLEIGGAELMLCRLVKAMRDRAVTARVVSLTDEGDLAPTLREAGVEVRTLGLARGQLALRPVLTVRRWLREWRPDLLSTWMYHADLLGAIATFGRDAPPMVWNLRASHIDMRHYRWLSGATRRACAVLSRRPAVVVANSRVGRAAHEALGYRPRAWRVIANGVDTDRFRPQPDLRDAVRASLGVPLGAVVVCVFARLDPMKGHDVFASALSTWLPRAPHVHALVAGTGVTDDAAPYNAVLRTQPDLRSRLHLLGPRIDVDRLMAASDLACCPSRSEGFANAVAEAMACELPCVTTDVGDNAELVDDRSLVVPPGDPLAIAERLDAISNLADAARREIGRVARIRVLRHYSMASAVEAYLKTYQDVADGIVRTGQRGPDIA